MTRNMLLYRKGVRNSLHTHQLCIKAQTHTGADSLMPVFFRQGCRKEGGGMEEREQAEDESRRRAIPIKNDSRQRTRQGTQRKKKILLEKGKDQKNPHWRGVGNKTE